MPRPKSPRPSPRTAANQRTLELIADGHRYIAGWLPPGVVDDLICLRLLVSADLPSGDRLFAVLAAIAYLRHLLDLQPDLAGEIEAFRARTERSEESAGKSAGDGEHQNVR